MTLTVRNLSPLAYALTRIGGRFLGGDVLFSPGAPLQPVAHETTPRRFQYPSAVNQVWEPRRDLPGLTAFDVLRVLNKRHALAALCVRVRSMQIMAIRGGVVARKARDAAAEQGTCDALNAFFAQPDGINPRASWLQMLIRDLLEIDAPTVYKRPARGGGLASLEVIDGSTIKPLLDDRGRAVAYQQVLYGMALSQYRGVTPGLAEEEIIGEYAPGELWYQPYTPATASPYGRPPMEDLIALANIFLQKVDYDLKHFTEGNIPAALGVFNEAALNPEQVAAFEDNFNATIQGDPSRMAKIKFVPFPLKIERLSQLSTGGQYESAFEERNVKIVTAMYGVTPSEIGFTADVNRATADSQENVTYRIGIRPLLEWLKVTLFDPIIQVDLAQPQLEWMWDIGETEDREALARVHGLDIQNGVIRAQESRTIRYPDLPGDAPGAPLGTAQPAPVAMLAKKDDAPFDEDVRLALIDDTIALLRRVFGGHADRVISTLREAETADAMRAALASFWPDETARLTQQVLPAFDAMVAAGMRGGAAQLPIVADYGMVNQAALKLARERAAWWASTAAVTSDKQIAQAIADWIETGGTLPDLLKRVTAISERWVDDRTEVNAVTEVTRLFARANRLAWQESGVVRGYKVQTSRDERVCPVCGPRQGKEYALTDEDGQPPFHSRCRCWITPIVEEP